MSDSKLFGREKGKYRMSLRITMMAFIMCALFVAGGIGYKDYCELNKLYFVIDVETSASGVVQVFYDVGSGYNEADSYSITEQSGSWQKLIFPLSPSKAIRSIRFDPINVPSLVRVKNAWIENRQGAVVKVFPLSDFKNVQQIDKMDVSAGALNILTQKNAGDPITQIENSSIESQCSWKDYIAKRSSIIIGYGLLISLVLTSMSYFSSKVQRLNAAVGEKLKEVLASIGLVSSIALSILVVVRWWYYIDSYSVNILFWDQWDFYSALFDKKNIWELFHMQFGPHRMGMGFIFTKAIASFSGWNTRAEDFAIGGVVCLAMVVALVLRTKLGPRLCWTDVAIPLIFLIPGQYEIYAGTPIPSHGAVPLLLLALYCLVWAVWRGMARCCAILFLNFLLIYTGFGVFAGMITPCLFCAEAFHAHRARDRKGFWLALTAVVVSLLSAGSFFVGYHFSPAIEGFRFPVRQWWHYPIYVALMLANFCGVKGITPVSCVVGFLILFLLVVLALIHMVRISRSMIETTKSSTDAVVAILTTFTLLFCVNTAIGRVPLGLPTAQASRYITNMIPGFFGIYIWLVALPHGVLRRFLLTAAVAGLIAATFPLREADRNGMKWLVEGKTKWKAAYLQTEDIETATRAANFPIYPVPERTRLKQKLEYLKKEKLNLYLDAPPLQLNP
jgi:hypothetical protein